MVFLYDDFTYIVMLEICTQHLSLITGSFVWNWYAKNGLMKDIYDGSYAVP